MREDMLTLFNRTASFKSLECSMVLQGSNMLSSEMKYKTACILEIVTGQRVIGASCEVLEEDPMKKSMSEEQRRDLDRVRGIAMRQSLMAHQQKGKQPKKGNNQPIPQLTADDLRKLGNGFKLKNVLHGVKLFEFLEKCREFYLPDVVGTNPGTEGPQVGVPDLPDAGHPNHLKHAHMVGHFERYTPSGTLRRSLGPADNPKEAVATYLLKSSDLLKFPDIELHFESMGNLISREGSDSTLHLILRPTLQVDPPKVEGLEEFESSIGYQADHLKIMNYLLSQYFNMYMHRPRVSGPFYPQQ